MTTEKPIDYDNIYSQSKQSKSAGRIKLIGSGIGWKETSTGSVTTLRADDFKKLQWLRAARDYQLRIFLKNGTICKFDGFPREAFDTLKEFSKGQYNLNLEAKDLSLKGWNWGKTEIRSNNLEFQVQGKTMFEIPFSDISSAMVSAKNEVTVETVPTDGKDVNKKADNLVDIRFYIPPSVVEEDEGEEDEDSNIADAATGFCNTLKSAAQIGVIAQGAESIVLFQELPFMVPRGRYEADMYSQFMRLRGKSYDYKISYSSIIKLFLLPKSDDLHVLLVMSLEPPLRQGQTRYPFLIIQFSRELMISATITFNDEVTAKFAGKLEKEYSGPQYEVFSTILKILGDKKLIIPGHFKSYHGAPCVKCSTKANEGHIYFLERYFLFVPKPCILIPHEDLASVTFSRVDFSVANARTFDVKFILRGGTDHQFSNINKEELATIEEFLRDKKIKFQSELVEAKKQKYVSEDEESEDEAIPVRSDGEEEESSTDEDYEEGDSEASGSEDDSGADSEDEEVVSEDDE